MSVNKVILVGRLGKDPETKTMPSGQMLANLTLATSESWLDKSNGQKQERTEWHRVVVWGKQAELCSKYLSKGRQIYIEGRLQTRSWDDPQGQKRYSTEVVANMVQFLGGNAEKSNSGFAQNSFQQGSTSSASAGESVGNSSIDFGPEPSFDPSEQLPF